MLSEGKSPGPPREAGAPPSSRLSVPATEKEGPSRERRYWPGRGAVGSARLPGARGERDPRRARGPESRRPPCSPDAGCAARAPKLMTGSRLRFEISRASDARVSRRGAVLQMTNLSRGLPHRVGVTRPALAYGAASHNGRPRSQVATALQRRIEGAPWRATCRDAMNSRPSQR